MLKILLLISSTIYGVLDLWAAASQRSQHYRTSFAMGRVYDVEVECELYHHMMNEASELSDCTREKKLPCMYSYRGASDFKSSE